MKTVLFLCSVVALAVAQTYDASNDNFDIERLVKDDAALQRYTNCFIRNTDCDVIATDFKKDLKEVYEQSCAKCTPAQKHILKKYIEALKQKLPNEYQEFKKTYDPEGKYSLALETAIATA